MAHDPTGRSVSSWRLLEGTDGSAVFSSDGTYRYWLERRWDRRHPLFAFLLLNPSTATGDTDDPTTRKLQRVSTAHGGGGYVLVNLFALVDTGQTRLHLDGAVGESADTTDRWVDHALGISDRIVIGWGTGGSAPRAGERSRAVRHRVQAVWPMLASRELWCVGQNRAGSPRHPGRGVANGTALRRFVPAPAALGGDRGPAAPVGHPRP